MKRRLIFLILSALVLGLMVWIDRQPTSVQNVCLPLPDLSSWMMPTPTLETPYPAPPRPEVWDTWPAAQRIADVNRRVRPLLKTQLEQRGLSLGSAVYLRAYKDERELELWLKGAQGWQLWRSYPVAAASGRRNAKATSRCPKAFTPSPPVSSIPPAGTTSLSTLVIPTRLTCITSAPAASS